jgi:Fur family ferric uptake transcriptional regulator
VRIFCPTKKKTYFYHSKLQFLFSKKIKGLDKPFVLCYNLRTVLNLRRRKMRKKRYKTAGREALIGFFRRNPDRQFTVEELYTEVNAEAPTGKSSLYRHLTELCGAEVLRKFHGGEGRGTLYQYIGAECDCKDHFHQKCTVCGRVSHLDCFASAEFAEHMLREHGFLINCGRSVLYGVCAACMRKGEPTNA